MNPTADNQRKRGNINYITLFDPASYEDYVGTAKESTCDTHFDQSELYRRWLAENPNNNLTIFAGEMTTDKKNTTVVNGRIYAHKGIQEKLFSAIRGTVLSSQVVVCNYGSYSHTKTYENLKDFMNKPKITDPSQCPRLADAEPKDMIGWRP